MNKTIFITRKVPEMCIKLLEEKGYTVDVNPKDSILSQKDLIKYLKKKSYDAVVTLLTDHIDENIFKALPNIKMYANYATGYDNIDIIKAKELGITITNAPAPFTSEAVAEHALGLMFALAMRTVEGDRYVREGKYKGWSAMNLIGTDILGKTLGIVGAGRIGSRMGFYAKGLGLNVIYYDIKENEQIEKECGAKYYASLDQLLKEADIVSIHVPLFDSTKHLINEDRLKIMKKTSFLINTSRGPVIDEIALVKALQAGIIRGAALDVFEFEPKISKGLVKLQNVVLTPHISSASEGARDEMDKITAENIIDFLEGHEPKNVINK